MPRLWFALLVSILLSACASSRNNNYYPPHLSPGHKLATLAGSAAPPVSSQERAIAYVAKVNGQFVYDAKRTVSQPIELKPGVHEVGLAWNQDNLYATVVMTLNAEPGQRYVIRHEPLTGSQVKLWIENEATHAAVTEAKIVAAAAPFSSSSAAIAPLVMNWLRVR
jgi:hypothetical protein